MGEAVSWVGTASEVERGRHFRWNRNREGDRSSG